LPLYLSTFGDNGGPYFVLWFCSFCFTLLFGMISLFLYSRGAITTEMRSLRWHPYLALVGLSDSWNGFLIVYSSPLSRTSGPLQSILGQTFIPFTLLFSRFLLGKVYTCRQLVGAFIVIAGAFIALAPMFKRVHDGTYSTNNEYWWWPLLFCLGQVPGSLMNIFGELQQQRFTELTKQRMSVMYFQFVESFYQLCSMSIFFWLDILPNFGSSSNLAGFNENYKFGWKCFFGTDSAVLLSDRCKSYSGGFGSLFVFFYMMSYIFSTLLTMYASANLVSVVAATGPVLALLFWYAFPSVNDWADGTPYSLDSLDGICNILALPFMLAGVALYRYHEDTTQREPREAESIQLLWD